MKVNTWLLAVCLVFITFTNSIGFSAPPVEKPAKQYPAALKKIQIPFVENRGQYDAQVRYYVHTFGGTLFVTNQGEFILSLPAEQKPESGCLVIRERPKGAREPRIEGLVTSDTTVNWYVGKDPVRWQRSLPTFDMISLGEVYPGVVLNLRVIGKNVEKRFHIRPGADPHRILWEIDGADNMVIARDGSLLLDTPQGRVSFTPPAAYQLIDGLRRSVSVQYHLDGTTYGFRVGDYDRSRELVIDPLYATTYLGGSGGESIRAVSIHPSSQDIFVTGGTTSTQFGGSGTVLAYGNAYVARLNAQLTALEAITFIGGDGNDSGQAIYIYPSGSPLPGRLAIMGGTDDSVTFPNFPTTRFGSAGNNDIFVAYLNTNTLAVTQAAILAGSFNDYATAFAVHPSTYRIYIAGDTNSADLAGISGLGGAQPSLAGVRDAFIVCMNYALTAMEGGTFLGGSTGSESYVALAIQPTGGIYVKGVTNANNFPTTDGAAQETFGGGTSAPEDLFVASFSNDLSTLQAATYLGGFGLDETGDTRLEIGSSGSIYIGGKTRSSSLAGAAVTPGNFIARLSSDLSTLAGVTTISAGGIDDILLAPGSGDIYMFGSTGSTLPAGATTGAAQPSYGGGLNDLFVALYSGDLTILRRTTYLGGSDRETLSDLALHPSGGLYLTGYTRSEDFPGVSGGAQDTHTLLQEGFIAWLSNDLTDLSQATYFGGSEDDTPQKIIIEETSGDVYIAGFTTSSDLPGTAGSAQPAMVTQPEGFMARFDRTLRAGDPTGPQIDVSPASRAFPTLEVDDQDTQVFTVSNQGDDDLEVSGFSLTSIPDLQYILNLTAGDHPCGSAIILPPDQSCTVTVTFKPRVAGPSAGTLTVASDDSDDPSLEVNLTGDAFEPGRPMIKVTPSPSDLIDFGRIGTTRDPAVEPTTTNPVGVRIVSAGSADLTVSRIWLSGPASSAYVLDLGTCDPSAAPTILAPTEECYVRVHGEYSEFGQFDTTLNIESDAALDPVVNLVFTGTLLDCRTDGYCNHACSPGEDPDCVEDCTNGVDDDGDGFIDCADLKCMLHPSCAEDCANGVDDDGDGHIDCADGDCALSDDCVELCTNSIDDDGDGLVDCADHYCDAHPACPNHPCWELQVLDSAVTSVDIDLDASDNVHLCYFLPEEGGSQTIRYLTGALAEDPDDWGATDVETFDGIGKDCAIAVDSEGVAHVVYIVDNRPDEASNDMLRYAVNREGTWENTDVNICGKGNCSIALDSGGSPTVSFRTTRNRPGYGTIPEGENAFVTNMINLDRWGELEPSPYLSEFTNLYTNPLGGPEMVFSYESIGFYTLYWTDFESDPLEAELFGGGNFSGFAPRLAIDNKGYHHFADLRANEQRIPFLSCSVEYGLSLNRGRGGETFKTSKTVFEYYSYTGTHKQMSLDVDTNGEAHIAYYDLVDLELRYVNKFIEEIPSSRNVQISERVDTSDANVGWSAEIAVTSSQNPVIAYIDRTNNQLKLAHRSGCNGPVLSVSPLRWKFIGHRTIGNTRNKEHAFHIRNIGTEDVVITEIEFNSEIVGFSEYACSDRQIWMDDPMPIILTPDENRDVCIKFRNWGEMRGPAQLVIESSNANAVTADILASSIEEDTGADEDYCISFSLSNPDGNIDIKQIILLGIFSIGFLVWWDRRRRS